MKTILIAILSGSCGVGWAQTNAPTPPATPETTTEIWSQTGYFDGKMHQMVYQGQVIATDAKSTLRCGQLTVDLPPNGGHPSSIVAETNVVIDVLDEKGQTNHITAAKAVYAYSVVNAVTNEMVTFTGGEPTPKVENSQFILTGDPLVLNLATRRFSGSNYRTVFKETGGAGKGTNASPFHFLK